MHCTAAQPFVVSESLILVGEGSVQLVSTSRALRLPRNVERLFCCDARACDYTAPNRCFSGPERWF